MNAEAVERFNNYRGFLEYRNLDKREGLWLMAQMDIEIRDNTVLQHDLEAAEGRYAALEAQMRALQEKIVSAESEINELQSMGRAAARIAEEEPE